LSKLASTSVFFLCIALTLSLRAAPPQHWAYQPVVRPALPAVKDREWPINAIDYFILAKLEAAGLRPAPEAPPHQLLRRVSFDLTGLPPDSRLSLRESRVPDTYERAVDQLLNSPRYGERMATFWLDLARYADTHGYHVDSHRDMWRYRDEVVSAFNRHQPFDQFTIEQLAGDLLPQATLEQKIASGFNRNHMTTFERGAISEEYLNEYAVDRVATTATVWLAQTMKCAQCHDHKYDPFSTRDFYSLAAFFNNVPGDGLDGRLGNIAPLIKAPTKVQQQQLANLDSELSKNADAIAARAKAAAASELAWEMRLAQGTEKLAEAPRDMTVYFPLDETEGTKTANAARDAAPATITGEPTWTTGKFQNALLFDGSTSIDAGDVAAFKAQAPFTISLWIYPTTSDTMTLLARCETNEQQRGYEVYLAGGRLYVALRHSLDNLLVVRSAAKLPISKWRHVAIAYDGSGEAAGIRLYLSGEAQNTEALADTLAGGRIDVAQPLTIGRGAQEGKFRGLLDEIRGYDRALSAGEVALIAGSNPVLQLLAIARDKRTLEQAELIASYYLEHYDAPYRQLQRQQATIAAERRTLLNSCPTTMIMAELSPPRKTFVLEHGSYAHPGEEVTPDTPAVFPPLPKGAPHDRLTFARWLVDGQHPLTARVMVNRLWQLHFGQGLVSTPDDFGLRGARPTHPELLDWLADEFVASGWNIQHIQRLIVTSASYRQRCMAASDNSWLAGFPRERLRPEMLRDQALALSGLLVGELGGSGVFPYQPPGLWEEAGVLDNEYTMQSYKQSHGADLYRRSLYTFWKRGCPPPNMTTFDAPNREVCTSERGETNTPLQALVLWNDPIYLEAARQLASLAMRRESSDDLRIHFIFERILGRAPTAAESAALARLFARERSVYGKDLAAAQRLLRIGETPADPALDPADFAAWTLVAHAVFNLDEAISRN
jgi:hypothetical protein